MCKFRNRNGRVSVFDECDGPDPRDAVEMEPWRWPGKTTVHKTRPFIHQHQVRASSRQGAEWKVSSGRQISCRGPSAIVSVQKVSGGSLMTHAGLIRLFPPAKPRYPAG